MDAKIREELKILSKHIQDVGRQIGSTKIDIEGLMSMRETLKLGGETLDVYIRMAKADIEE